MVERMAENERRRRDESIRTLPQMMHGLSLCVFGVEKLRAEQKVALLRCVDPQFNDSKLLLVTRTGSGKSHVTRTLGVMMNGITIIFVPLLSLSADQMKKMEEAKQCFGSVETHHCDEIPTDDGGIALQAIVNRIKELDDTTTSTIFLFASPQFLCKRTSKPLLDELLSAQILQHFQLFCNLHTNTRDDSSIHPLVSMSHLHFLQVFRHGRVGLML